MDGTGRLGIELYDEDESGGGKNSDQSRGEANPVPPRGILRIRTTKVTIKLFKQRIRISIVAGVDPANPYGSIM